MIEYVKGSLRDNDDCVIMLDGPEGSGKSTLGFHLCKFLEPDWQPETSLIIDYDDWLDLYQDGREKQVLLLDEGGKLLFSRDAMTGENKHLVEVLQQSRIMNNVLVICCPNIRWLDVYVREHRAVVYIQVHKYFENGRVVRGKATVRYRKRWFDWQTSATVSRWEYAYDLAFDSTDESDPEWQEYIQVKKAKIVSSGQEKALKNLKRRT